MSHRSDEFFGNLNHLNAEEKLENIDYPKDPEFRENSGPRDVIRSSSDVSIEDTGSLTRKRMETIDEEVTAGALDFMQRAHDLEKPFFLWYRTTRMHIHTHLKDESQGVTGLGDYPDGMVEHDKMVGQMLDRLEELGIADNTVVMYSTDNGAEVFSWPDGGTKPFRGEKNDNWEGGFRVPMMIKWPGVIEPGRKSNNIISHLDWFPTLMSALGDGDLMNLPYNRWKVVFAKQRAHGFVVWKEPLTFLCLPKIIDLYADPFERAEHESIGYARWRLDRTYLLVPAQAFVAQFLSTFQDYPPRQKPASFSIDQVLESLQRNQGG